MTLLIHVEHRGGITIVRTGLIERPCLVRVVHGEVATRVHTAVGGNMRFEVAPDDNAAHHRGGGIILGNFIGIGVRTVLIGHATVDGEVIGIAEVP